MCYEQGSGKVGWAKLRAYEEPVGEQPVAIKTMWTQLADDPALRERFQREASSTRQLIHGNIVAIRGVGEDAGCPYYVMEYLEGKDLKTEMGQGDRRPLEQKLRILWNICRALSYAHERGVIHGDIKPSNIFITTSDDVKLLDFGGLDNSVIAAMAQEALGTPGYAAPEQWEHREVTQRSDIFALGAVMYELLTGRRAFECTTTVTSRHNTASDDDAQRPGYIEQPMNQAGGRREQRSYEVTYTVPDLLTTENQAVPPGLSSIVLKMLATDAAQRYATMDDVLRDLEIYRANCCERRESLYVESLEPV